MGRESKRNKATRVAQREGYLYGYRINLNDFIRWTLEQLGVVVPRDRVAGMIEECFRDRKGPETSDLWRCFAYALDDAGVDRTLTEKDVEQLFHGYVDNLSRRVYELDLAAHPMLAVKTSAETTAAFADRLAALHILEKSDPHAGKSWDERRRLLEDEGRVEHHADGSRTVEMSEIGKTIMQLQHDMFAFKFGRPPQGNDPIFFDTDASYPMRPDSDEMMAAVRATAQKANIDPDRVVEHFFGKEELHDYKRSQQ